MKVAKIRILTHWCGSWNSTENCQPASGSSGYTVADYIRRIALQFGVVTVFKAYLELEKTGPSKVKTLLSELQSSGVSLIDCPHNGCKEVADKMLLGTSMCAINWAPINFVSSMQSM